MSIWEVELLTDAARGPVLRERRGWKGTGGIGTVGGGGLEGFKRSEVGPISSRREITVLGAYEEAKVSRRVFIVAA